MSKAFVKIGKLGRAHGLHGEIKARIEDHLLDDALKADSLLVEISGQQIPYFVEAWRSNGTIIKFEDVEDKEAATLLQHKDIYMAAGLVSEDTPPADNGTPYDHLLGWIITDISEGTIGKILGIVDLPQHYLAEVEYEGKVVILPLHDDLIDKIDEKEQVIMMDLPSGLLKL